jgi:hypothetical protein
MTGAENDGSANKGETLPGMEFDEYFEREYLRTGNPLYVWQALNSLNVYGAMSAAHEGVAASTPRAIPVWCIQYLMNVATRIHNLCNLLDERNRPNDSEGYAALVKWANSPTLSSSDAAHRANGALGIDGAAFTKFRSDQKRAEAFLEFENLVAAGLPVNEAEREIGKRFGWGDERTVRRYMAEQREAGKNTR